jgi:hypothetical protein
MSAFLKRVSPAGLIVLVVALLAAAPVVAAPPTASAPAPKSNLADLAAKAPVMSCEDLAKADLSGVADKPIHITSATEVIDGKPAPYCKVLGYVEPAVKFEVHLPLSGWTQRYVQTGCGGTCGRVGVRTGNDMGCAPSQNGELVLASTDMGHSSEDKAWGDDPQKRIDFAYRGVHVTSVVAKALTEKYYGQKPKYSYFAGCSDGGREALMEAQRYPQDFNGITAGAAAMNFLTQNTFYHGWQARVNTDANGKVILGAEKMPILHQAALDSCDAVDGLKDGLIADPRACRFDPAVVQCKPGQDAAACLSPEQVKVAQEIYRGAHDANGRQLVISGPQVGSELMWPGVQVPRAAGGQDIGSKNFASEVLAGLVYDRPFQANYSLNDFRFDQQSFEELKPMHAVYDATDPDLSKFAATGGKLIVWHGLSDPHISPLNSIAYYRAMLEVMGETKVKSFARMYLFPGGGHCGGGDGPFNFDLLSAIMSWVETGNAPYKLVATHTVGGPGRPGAPSEGGRSTAGPGGPSAPGGPGAPGGAGVAAPPTRLAEAPGLLPSTPGKVDRSRPVFPYPLVARYTGKGSPDDAENFVAETPKQQLPEKFDWLGSSFFTSGYEKW